MFDSPSEEEEEEEEEGSAIKSTQLLHQMDEVNLAVKLRLSVQNVRSGTRLRGLSNLSGSQSISQYGQCRSGQPTSESSRHPHGQPSDQHAIQMDLLVS